MDTMEFKLSDDLFSNERKLDEVFSWLSSIGAAPSFGSRPIGWYQMHQCAAIDILIARAGKGNIDLKVKHGVIYARNQGSRTWWNIAITPRMLFDEADRKTRA